MQYQCIPKDRLIACHTSQDIFDILTEHKWCLFTFASGSTFSSTEGSCASMKVSEDTVAKKVKNNTATKALIVKAFQQLTKYTMMCCQSQLYTGMKHREMFTLYDVITK